MRIRFKIEVAQKIQSKLHPTWEEMQAVTLPVVGISTDKASSPINVMGMTKAIQERILIASNIFLKKTKILNVRYGNVIASRGSVIPLFAHQIENNKNLTLTDKRMTRFLLNCLHDLRNH